MRLNAFIYCIGKCIQNCLSDSYARRICQTWGQFCFVNSNSSQFQKIYSNSALQKKNYSNSTLKNLLPFQIVNSISNF